MRRLKSWVSIGLLACVAMAAANAEAKPKKRKKPPPAAAAPADDGAEFDRQAAVTAIAEVNLQRCKATNAAKGEGHVVITFSPEGAAKSARIDKGPWIGTPVAKCMQKEFKKAKVPAFKGDAVTVGKSFHFD